MTITDEWLLSATIFLARKYGDVAGAMVTIATYADGDDRGITPADICDVLECTQAIYMEALSMLDRAGSFRPAARAARTDHAVCRQRAIGRCFGAGGHRAA
jgi:hypothetical protein